MFGLKGQLDMRIIFVDVGVRNVAGSAVGLKLFHLVNALVTVFMFDADFSLASIELYHCFPRLW